MNQETKQAIVYDSRLKLFTFYRGGYDFAQKRGVDPYKRATNPVGAATRLYPDCPIENGTLFYCGVGDPHWMESKAKIGKFFFGADIDLSQDQVTYGQYMMCFDSVGRIVLWKKGEPSPERISKICKTRKSNFYKTWIKPYTEYSISTPPVIVKGLKFKKGQEFLVLSCIQSFYCLIPEYAEKLQFSFEKYACAEDWYKELEKVEPIDLSYSWDYTEEEKAEFEKEINAIKEQRRKEQEEREKRKATLGYCDFCGEPTVYRITRNEITQSEYCESCWRRYYEEIGI